MTTMYANEEEAIAAACRFAGVDGHAADNITPVDETIETFGGSHSVKKYAILNKFGKPASFGIGPFRDGFELWLFGPNGEAIRT